MRFVSALSLIAACGTFASIATAQKAVEVLPEPTLPHLQELELGQVPIETMRVRLRRNATPIDDDGGFGQRDGCPGVSTYTNASFTGGTYVAQGGFAEQEIAAVSYTLPSYYFPLRFVSAECIFAQQNASTTTTTQWSVIIYDGTPNSAQPAGFPEVFSSDGSILPHIVMGPGTRGTNVQATIDINDPEQIYIFCPPGQTSHTFSVGFRIDQHNAQSGNPCTVAPPSALNAFPTTDNVTVGCGTGYAQLNYPNDNWLFAVNCGANGCPPNGGWTRLSALQTDISFGGFCITGCRPRGDWVMRATWDPVNCPPPDGACCFGANGCFITNQTSCQGAGGVFQGGGTTCGVQSGGTFPGCTVPPNENPIANAGSDQTTTDTDNNGSEVIVVSGNGSIDFDGSIVNYRWNEGPTVLQDGPSFMSTTLPVGSHTLTLTVTDNRGGTGQDTVLINILPGAGACPWAGGCAADFDADGDFDSDDIVAFFNAWDNGDDCGDADNDGDTDSDDIGVFFTAWDSGEC